MKCKSYSKITVEIRTQLKTVTITSDIFAVYIILKIVKIVTKWKIKEQFTNNAPREMFLALCVVPSLGYGRVLITNLQVICNVHTILHRS